MASFCFCVFMDLDSVSIHKHAKKEVDQYPAILTSHLVNNPIYYKASSMRRQDESNPALWLATRTGKMELSCPLGTTLRVLHEKFPWKPYSKSFIDQACLVKMAGYWPHSFFVSLWTEMESRSINTQKVNLANIQPSWPHTWSITHKCFNKPQAPGHSWTVIVTLLLKTKQVSV